MDGPSETEEQIWCANQRADVIAYLASQGVRHGQVGEWPAWHLWPYLAVWAIESAERPGWVGWWAISGDVPTDYTTCGPERHPRAALRDIARRWKKAVAGGTKTSSEKEWSIGAPDDWPEIAPLLGARADLLLSFAADDDLWRE